MEVTTNIKKGDGQKKAVCFDRNGNDEREFIVFLDSKFDFLRYSNYERKICSEIEREIYENDEFHNHFSEDTNDIQFFVLSYY